MARLLIRLVLTAATLLAAHPWEAFAQSAVRFAVIGDYGLAGPPAAEVAALVKRWNPDLIITTGDNNYYYGAASTIDVNVGQYYAEFIHPYRGQYGPGSTVNRFFPTLGNHDWEAPGAQPYLDYFTLPGNERYYDFVWGPVHFFALSSDPSEPDGREADSVQGTWLRHRLAASTAPWKIVYLHHAPLSSGHHGSSEAMRWPYEAWGASAVLSGHDHTYERITVDDFPYFVNGLGGASPYEMAEVVAGSQVRFQSDHGAMRVEATEEQITFEFITRRGVVVDRYTLYASPDARRPDPPGHLTATGVAGREIDLRWIDNSSNEGGFRVEQWTGSAWAPVAAPGANITAHRVGGLTPRTTYRFRLVATGAAGDSAPSAPAATQTLAAGPPAAPSGLTAQAAVPTGRITLAWVDNSLNETGFTVEQSLDGVTFAPIAALDRNTRSHGVTGLAPDVTHHYRVRAVNSDGPSPYSNTATARTGPAADLVVTEMYNPPASAAAGSSFGVRDWVRNQGAGPAGPSTTRYHLSRDAFRDSSDVLLGGSRPAGPLTPGQTSKGSVTATIPSSTVSGPYYLLACADDLVRVIETSRANNCRASQTRIQVGPPASLVTLMITLAGTGSGSVTGPGIACGLDCTQAVPSGTAVTLTASAAPNARFGGWSGGGCGSTSPCATVLTASAEIVATFTPATTVPGDLVVTVLADPPASAAPGGTFAASDTVANSGSSSAGASTTRYYLSALATRTSAAVRLAGSRAVPVLGAGAASAGSTHVTIPATLAPGLYYLLACADDVAQVVETGETNNCRTAAGRLQLIASPATPADLIVTELHNPPASGAPGSSFGARDSVLNRGAGPAGPSAVRYYLSRDSARDPSDVLLDGRRSVGSLARGQASQGSITVTVPATIASGLYYLLACADDLAQVPESDEINNCRPAAGRLQLTGPPPPPASAADLVVTEMVSPPAFAAPGSSFGARDWVLNQGTGPAGPSLTRYYLSLDTLGDPSDIPLGDRSVGSLAAGQAGKGSITVSVPTSVAPGLYYMLACTDGTNQVGESNEANNCRASQTRVAIGTN